MTKFIVFFVGVLAGSLTYGQIKTPSELKDDVRFWEGIFGKFSTQECVFHDSKHLDVIYGVVKDPRRKHRKKLAAYKSRIRRVLENMARGDVPQTVFSKTVYKAIPRSKRSRSFYRYAAKRVRCQRGNADHFEQSFKRSRKYIGFVRKEIEEHGLPADLAYLPFLESGYHTHAKSKVGARGLWQLMPSSAREAGLKVNWYRDDRVNVSKSTRAAVKILRRNYRKVGSWPLAVTGYNYGINGIMRGVRKLGTKDYMSFRKRHQSRIFGFAAKNFYPSFLAVRNLALRKEGRKIKRGLLF